MQDWLGLRLHVVVVQQRQTSGRKGVTLGLFMDTSDIFSMVLFLHPVPNSFINK